MTDPAPMMRAWQVQDGAEAPQPVTLPRPQPGPGQVGVAIRAAALNFADLLMLRGQYQDTPPRPYVPGMEAAGLVTATGPGVTSLSVGDRVAVFAGQGALAEAGVFDADACWPLPEALDFATGAALPIAHGTSHLALAHRAGLRAGQVLAVLGAAGGVGLTAVEIGARLGARVIACARGTDKLAIARAAGAHEAIDSTDPDLRQRLRDLGGVDVVYDAVGGAPGAAAFGALRPGGQFLLIGFAAGAPPDLKLNHALVKNLTIHGLYWGGYRSLDPALLRASLTTVLDWAAAGQLRPHIGTRFGFDDLPQALETLRAGRGTGKIVIDMDA
ncbi:NADPH:quinone oxidoreductase family protein [Paracoccus sp. p3-h83]|uniref:NADPH:quinone oxidoreductase family protein n=1 Tax=Paracoccus sp. p3-h83 TaxID=3342805 RepID=UPI0035B8B572